MGVLYLKKLPTPLIPFSNFYFSYFFLALLRKVVVFLIHSASYGIMQVPLITE